jgi:hypothetical protein
MAWTYTGDPASSNRDAVRFAIGDTDAGDQQVQDAEIDYLLGLYPNPLIAGAHACRRLAAKYARQVSKAVGSASLQASDRMRHYADLAELLLAEATGGAGAGSGLTVYAGGLSEAEKESDREDTDLVQPALRRDLLRVRGSRLDDEDADALE